LTGLTLKNLLQKITTLNPQSGNVPGNASPGGDDLVVVISRLWDDVLERGAAAREASILDLKVGVLRVHRLFEKIKQATKVSLPITVMFQAPTRKEIINLIRLGHAPAAKPLAELKKGDDSPPLFIFPGIGGVALELAELARLIHYNGPIYANQPRGLDGSEPPHLSVAAMADYQVGVIKAARPCGPYRLMGYSFGGLVAMEVARRLLAAGDTVDFLGLIEPTLAEQNWTLLARLEFFWRRIKHHAGALSELSPSKIMPYIASHGRTGTDRLRRLLGAKGVGVSPYHREGLPPGLEETRAAGNSAFLAYALAPYPGKATLLCSEEGDAIGCDARLIYPKYLAQCEILQCCGGDHSTMLRKPHVQELAQHISRCLGEFGPSQQYTTPLAAIDS
jgi:thioesterase domain-containing protein